MSTRLGEEMIEDYLLQLRGALRSAPTGRREQIVKDVAQHIAEARAEEPSSDEPTISRLLDRIGPPEAIAAAFEETSDTGGELQPPSPVHAAVRLMYAGAVISVVTAFADLLTSSDLKSAMQQGLDNASRAHGLPELTPSQVNSAATTGIVIAVIVSVFSAALWVLIARTSTDGQRLTRITATGLFGLDTLALLAAPTDLSVRSPTSRATDVCLLAAWLTGLVVIVLLWQRSSGRFLNSSRPRHPVPADAPSDQELRT
ncbi:MAG: hypothetical protein ABSA93_34670 [Streptosporangiaceae bacterium]|jgi:hypothetical protein